MTGRLLRRPPLAVVAGVGVGACGVAVAGSTLGVVAVASNPSSGVVAAIAGAGLAVTAAGTAVAALLADRFARRMRELRVAAVHRLRNPVDSDLDPWHHGGGFAELAELARTMDALTLRTRVADELAEQHRRTAETASAGMFELLSGLVAAEEGARGQLAAELHDTVAQSLAMARLQLALAPDPGALLRAQEYVDDAEEQVRAVMARTRPPALRDGDLATAMAHLRDEMEQRYGLAVDLSWPGTAYPLPLVTAITVYRFFQEALHNVVKHADVDWAQAALVVDEQEIVATVTDAGPGFDPAEVKPARGRHVGLSLLRERARLAGGSLEISSMPSAGTVLQLRLPRTTGAAGRVAEPLRPALRVLSA